jgi:hypothetical protein
LARVYKNITLSSHHPLSTLHPAFEDGTDRGFRNIRKSQSDAREIPKIIHTIFKTWRKFEIKCYKLSIRAKGLECEISDVDIPLTHQEDKHEVSV